MANYRAGDVIRLTRQAVGMTQEMLCENICSVETLSRIENGKHKGFEVDLWNAKRYISAPYGANGANPGEELCDLYWKIYGIVGGKN